MLTKIFSRVQAIVIIVVSSFCILQSALATESFTQDEVRSQLAVNWVQFAPSVYYRVYGYYPEKWADVRNSGLVQIELIVGGNVVDPDDGKFDFQGDIAYIYQGPTRAPQVSQLTSMNGMIVRTVQAAAAKSSYLQLFDKFESGGVEVPDQWTTQPSRLRFGMCACANHALLQHYAIYRNGVLSMQELLGSPASPYDAESVNPASGRRLGDELNLAGGFLFETLPANNSPEAVLARLYPLDETGQVLARFSF
jgi:hypothetical protein